MCSKCKTNTSVFHFMHHKFTVKQLFLAISLLLLVLLLVLLAHPSGAGQLTRAREKLFRFLGLLAPGRENALIKIEVIGSFSCI